MFRSLTKSFDYVSNAILFLRKVMIFVWVVEPMPRDRRYRFLKTIHPSHNKCTVRFCKEKFFLDPDNKYNYKCTYTT